MAEQPTAVIDLDGVVADVRHRLHHLDGRRRNWDAFFAELADDPVLPEGVAVVERLRQDHRIVYLTGRPERTRQATVAWLERHGLPRGDLLMRGDDDRRPARQTKVQAVRALIAAGHTVAVVVDDDPQVCAAMRDRGWPVLEADWVPRPRVLDRAQERQGGT
jgi:phosphoglycolate phosphatase-like HAD superfamily hydrolase